MSSDVKLDFRVVRPHFFKDSVYQLRLFKDRFEIASPGKLDQPKYRVQLCTKNTVGWQVKRMEQIQLTGIIIRYKNRDKLFLADHDPLCQLKQTIGGRILYQFISDFFDPISILGEGSFAKVILSKSKLSGTHYAVKLIKRDISDKKDHTFIENEIDILSHLTNQYSYLGDSSPFVRLWEVYFKNQSYHFVMDYVQGKSLEDYIQQHLIRGIAIRPQVVRIIIHRLAESLNLLHSQKIMHRDLKPENIMFTNTKSYKSLKIIDFGLASFSDNEEQQQVRCGTPGYVAPEILRSKRKCKYTEICDIFSLGVIFYRLLTGRNLFQSGDLKELIQLNKDCKIDYNSELFQMLEDDEYDLLKDMLCPDPLKRPTAKDLLEHPYLRQETIGRCKLDEKLVVPCVSENVYELFSDRQIQDLPIPQSPKLILDINDQDFDCISILKKNNECQQFNEATQISKLSFYQKGRLSNPIKNYISFSQVRSINSMGDNNSKSQKAKFTTSNLLKLN